MENNFNVSMESIMAQNEEVNAKKVYKKVNFDEKNYLDVKLKANENSKTLQVRLLPFSSELLTPFHMIYSHGIRVNKELAPTVKNHFKSYTCVKYTPELHEEHGDKCAICEAHERFKALAKEATNETEKKKYDDMAFQTRKSGTWIVRCIERGKESEGVKFWKFPTSKRNDGVYDKLFNLFKQRNEEMKKQGVEEGYNIFDLYNGKDIIITLTRGEDGKVSTNIMDAGLQSPLSKDDKQIMEWVNDPKSWMDVYGIKNYDYLKIVLCGEVPYYDKNTNRFIPKSEFEENAKAEEEKTEQEIIEELDKLEKGSEATESDMEDLPF